MAIYSAIVIGYARNPQPSFPQDAYISAPAAALVAHTYLYGARYDQEGAGRGRSRALHSAVCDVP